MESRAERTHAIFAEQRDHVFRRTDRMFAGLMIAQWCAAIVLALVWSPRTWAGRGSAVHLHVYLAVFLGAALAGLPVALAVLRPGRALTRHVIAVGQMLWSALLIHLTGGRIETHFHVFGSLAFLAFYRDWKVLIPASLVIAADNFLRGAFWPASVYGGVGPEPWRFLEHGAWVVYIDVFLVMSCIQGADEVRQRSARQAEAEALSEHLEEQRTVLDSQSEASMEGVLIVADDGRVLSYNRRVLEILGMPEDSMRESSRDLRLAMVAHRVAEPREYVARVKALLADRDIEATDEFSLVDGRMIERYTAPVRTPDGRYLGRGWYFRDITERVAAAQQVRALNADLERRVQERTAELADTNGELAARLVELRQTQLRLDMAARLVSIGRLSAGIAHEINNPLAYVVANLGYLERSLREAPSGVREGITEAVSGAERVRKIVAGLMTFARADEDRREPVDICAIVRSSARIAANEIRHRGRLIEDYGAVPPVEGDAGRLSQVFVNLLVNAAQSLTVARPQGNEIRVSTFVDDGRVVVEVADTGEGIADDVLDRLFDPFFTTKPIGVGTGLGLSICHGIVTAHGGEIIVDSQPGAGSRFRVILPATVRQPVPVPGIVGEREAVARKRVLVVDDEPIVLRTIERCLAGAHDVQALACARHAVEMVRAGDRFDVILCDVMMPGMTGMDVFAAVDAISPDQARRMVFLTGGAFTPEARAFLEGLSNPVVEKPFTIDSISTLVGSF